MEIYIDNQYVTKSLQRYRFLPKQPKEKHRKNHKIATFSLFRLGRTWNREGIYPIIIVSLLMTIMSFSFT